MDLCPGDPAGYYSRQERVLHLKKQRCGQGPGDKGGRHARLWPWKESLPRAHPHCDAANWETVETN